MVLKEKVYNHVKINGPIIPVQVARVIERDILFASAILSELVSEKKVMLTSTKMGGTPFYYVKGQEPKLQQLYNNLGDMPKKAYNLLREKKVLRDVSLEPAYRVAMREIKDFAKKMEVIIKGDTELFWKWYLANEDDAKRLIVKIVEGEPEVKREVKIEIKEEVKKVEVEKSKELKEDKISFKESLEKYFTNNNVKILKEEMVKKNKEFEYLADVSSEIGKLTFFVKALDKKKINEGDLSLAMNKSKGKPILFLSSGDLTKKAIQHIEKDMKGSLIFKKI